MKIPDGWKKVKFGDVVNKVNDKVPNREEWTFDKFIGGQHFDEGEIRITRSAPIAGNEEVIGSAFHMRFKPGQVLYVTRNPRLRKGGMVDFEGVCSNVSFVMEANEKQLLQSLLPFIIQTEDFVKHTCNNAHGSTNPFLNWKDIANYEFLLPPIEEQKKINEALWNIENNIRDIEKILSKVYLFQRRISSKLLNDQKSKAIKFSDIVEIIGGGTPKTSIPQYWNGTIPWLSVEDMDKENRWVYDTKRHITEEGLEKSSTKLLKKGELVISARGTVGVLVQLGKDMTFNQSNYGLRAKEITSNDYVYYLLKNKLFDLLNKTYGGVFSTITTKTFDQITVCVPSKQKQEEIIKKLNSIESFVLGINQYNASLKNLRNKLSNELLKGELRLK